MCFTCILVCLKNVLCAIYLRKEISVTCGSQEMNIQNIYCCALSGLHLICGLPASQQCQPHLNRTEQNDSSQSGVTVRHTSKGRPSSQILLATATVYVRHKWGQLVKCRALLDSASQGNFVTQHVVQQLHLRIFKAQIPVQGTNEGGGNPFSKIVMETPVLTKFLYTAYDTTKHNLLH